VLEEFNAEKVKMKQSPHELTAMTTTNMAELKHLRNWAA